MSEPIDLNKVRKTLTRLGIERPVTTVQEILQWVFGDLEKDSTIDEVENGLRDLRTLAQKVDGLRQVALREEAIKTLREIGVRSSARMVDAALTPPHEKTHEDAIAAEEIALWPEEVSGVELLDETRDWMAGYVVASKESLIAITLWAVATWFVAAAYFALILAILSPTKRSGKTLLLDLLRWICRKAELTSGVGITSAVIFRLNEQCQPTFLIDEAEKLGGKNANQEIISLLNQGYRRGSTVPRCREKGGEYIIERFNAFGFRAVAAIGGLWDTLLDRAVIIQMKRKPRTQKTRHFNGREVEIEGKALSRKINRFAQDNMEAFGEFQRNAPRPDWLNDRACDNWSSLFTVAELAGGTWPQKALDAAKALSIAAADGDRTEQLIQDIRQVFTDEQWPEVIKSGDLIQALNGIESSPWGDYNKGNGMTTHKVAAMFKPFEIRPHQERDSRGEKIRGYWLKDLQETFRRYPPPSELGQLGQPNDDGGSSHFQSGTKDEICPTSESPETRSSPGLSQLSQSERPKRDGQLSKGYKENL